MAEEKNDFDKLVDECIKCYAITLSDTTALDANGVLGKQRILVMEDERYQRETKILKARNTMDNLREIRSLESELNTDEEDEDDDEEGSADEIVPDEFGGFDDDFDIRNKGKKKDKKKDDGVKNKKLFDKSKMDMRLKLIQERREILADVKGEEEKEGDALNIFFVPITKEEFEKMATVEISSGVSTAGDAFNVAEEDEVQKKIKELKQGKEKIDGGGAFHYEEIDGVETIVENL